MKRKKGPSGLLYILVLGISLLTACGDSVTPSTVSATATSFARQTEIAAKGVNVMPFDLAQTSHTFTILSDGGLEKVTAKDPANREQIDLIRSHLQNETQLFRQGNFSDPMAIHGMAMPGIDALRQGAARITFTYSDLPDGAQIDYATQDGGLVAALRQWFDAQRSDHGNDAAGS